MAFAQLKYRESLRDIEVCLAAQHRKLYHAGFSGPVKRSTLANANESRDWRIYRDFAQSLIRIARPLYANSELAQAMDATCSLPILDRTSFLLGFIMLLAVHNGGQGRQLQRFQLPFPLPAVVLAECQVHLCRQISASSYDCSIQSIFVGRGASDAR